MGVTGSKPKSAIPELKSEVVASLTINKVPTKPIEGQKTGTSGLRKKTKLFASENYLANWVQSLFNALGDEVKGQTLVLGGDGRYYSKQAAQIIIKLAAGNGFGKVLVGKDTIMATPAMSATIRSRHVYGGIIMSASHNPGGPDNDFGIKFNYKAGEPAPEKITDNIYVETMKINTLNMAAIPDIDLSQMGVSKFGSFEVEVIDPVADYLATLKKVFDFGMISAFVTRPDFRMVFDAMWAVTGPYGKKIFVEELGAKPSSVMNGTPKEDFNGGHPDPNLTYAHELVDLVKSDGSIFLGAASDGDGDRNMILGQNGFFITPSDSVAMIAANAKECIPYFKNGLKGVARSMPTSAALDRVAEAMGLPFFETPTGWKFFGNLMDAGKCSVCGEESFGTGADHIREKDGIFAVLCWLSMLAHKNKAVPVGKRLFHVADIAMEHWNKFGRNVFSRYDYEECASDDANKLMAHVRGIMAECPPGTMFGAYELAVADDFEYTDPIDGSVASKQGLRFVFTDGSRIIFRLSGTGSSGATIRMYIEQYTNEPSMYGMDAQEVLQPIIQQALSICQMEKFTGRDHPTVIT